MSVGFESELPVRWDKFPLSDLVLFPTPRDEGIELPGAGYSV